MQTNQGFHDIGQHARHGTLSLRLKLLYDTLCYPRGLLSVSQLRRRGVGVGTRSKHLLTDQDAGAGAFL